jgi:hypothetical protein
MNLAARSVPMGSDGPPSRIRVINKTFLYRLTACWKALENGVPTV